MKRIFIMAAMLVALATGASAQKLGTPGTYDPPVINMNPPAEAPPTFSWTGWGIGVSVGQSQHTREYTRQETREWEEEIVHITEEEWEEHKYWCEKGFASAHFGPKCDVTGLTHAPEFDPLVFANSPWNNNRDETVRYNNGYDGLWMGDDDVFYFTLPEYVDPSDRGDKWAQIGYEYLSGVTITEWTEIVEYSETFDVTYKETHNDITIGAVANYRYQFEGTPFVVGGEINVFKARDMDETFTQIGLQGGVAVDRNLTFGEVGIEHFAVGNDYAFGREGNVILGVRYWADDSNSAERGDFDDSGTQVRAIFKF